MQQEPLSPLPLMSLLAARDTPLQTALRQKMSALNSQMAELLQQQPTFHSWVQYEFDQAFPDLTPAVDLLQTFIKPEENPPLSAQTGPQLSTALFASLMDAVVQRIVSNKAADHATRQTRFHRAADLESVTGLTPETFDTFLDSLANEPEAKYRQHLQRFWNHPHSLADSRTRKQILVATRTEHLQTEVALLRKDGLLSATSETSFTKVVRYPQALARQVLRGYHPCVYGLALKDILFTDIPLTGAFVLTSRDQADAEVKLESSVVSPQVRPVEPGANVGTVLLFSPETGLEEFESLASLDREVHRRLRDAAGFAGLSVLMADKDQSRGLAFHQRQEQRDQVRYIERLESVFDHGVESLCSKVLEDLGSTIARYQAFGVQPCMFQLAGSFDRVTDLTRVFDLSGVLPAREAKRVQARLKTFLKEASQADKEAWRTAVENHCRELSSLPQPDGLPSLVQFGDKLHLLAYSNEQLRTLLKAEHGLDVDPDHIIVHTKEPYTPPIVVVPGAPAPAPVEPRKSLYKSRSRTLTALALENVGVLDFNFTHFSSLTDNAQKPYAALTPAQVKDLVRTANIGDSYEGFLKDRLLTSSTALAQKEIYAQVMRGQLRVDAIEARIAGDFRPDRLERGFNWVQVVLDTPVDSDQRKQVDGQRILVQGLQLRGARVRGVLVFAAATTGVEAKVVYTPQAPGGRLFHEYPTEAQMHSDFVNHSAWHDYLLGRVGVAHQRDVRAFLKERIDPTLVRTGRIAGNFLEEAYEIEASVAINDAGAQSTTTQETNIDTAIDVAVAVFDIATVVLPVKVMLPIGLARSIFSMINAVEAASLGDRHAAAHHFVRALGELVGAVADGAMGGARSGGAKYVAKGRGLDPKMALGEKKPDDISPVAGLEDKGIYSKLAKDEAYPRYFANEEDHWYSITYDDSLQTWRVRDARSPYAAYHDPIRKNAQGKWEIRAPALGLKGGSAAESTLMDAFPYFSQPDARRILDAFNFPPGRTIEFELRLAREMIVLRDIPASFHQYLNAPLDNVRLMVVGLAPPTGPVAGPSRASALPVRPARPVALPYNNWVNWGEAIPAGMLVTNLHPANSFQMISLPGATRREFIKTADLHYQMLPRGADLADDNLAHIRNPNQPLSTFEDFEGMLIVDYSQQPRVALLEPATSVWRISPELPFKKTLTAYVGDAFPTFTAFTQSQVAKTLFHQHVPPMGPGQRLSSSALIAIQRTLREWPSGRGAGAGIDPLQLLETTVPTSHGFYPLNVVPGPLRQMDFNGYFFNSFHAALASTDDASLKALMIDVLVRNRYQVVSGFGPGNELFFKWPGRSTLYNLNLRRTRTNRVRDSGFPRILDLSYLSAADQAMVRQAQASVNLVTLRGGIMTFRGVDNAKIFIIRT